MLMPLILAVVSSSRLIQTIRSNYGRRIMDYEKEIIFFGCIFWIYTDLASVTLPFGYRHTYFGSEHHLWYNRMGRMRQEGRIPHAVC